MYFTYVLRSTQTGILYKGSTESIGRRLVEHNAGLSSYTSRYKPWVLVYFEVFPTRAEAMEREKFFKTGKGREFLKTVIAQSDDIIV